MEENKKCPKCGSNEIGQGEFTDYACLKPVNKFFSRGSEIIADICTECGHILSMRVKDPQKFK